MHAQNYLVVEHKDQFYVVRKVYNGFAYIQEGEKLVSVRKTKAGLVPAPEFLPVFVAVRNLKVSTSYVSISGSGNDINNTFHLQANFESPYVVPDAFLVLELHTENAGRQIYYQEIGTLKPGRPRSVEVHAPMGYKMGEGKFQLHLFSGGEELFHSQQPMPYREGMLDRMVVKRTAGLKDAMPAPFVGPVPEYPKSLLKAKTAGAAQVQIHLTRNGVVTNPVLLKASDPAFGESALEAVRQWRFLPRIKEGRPVESDVVMPFDFAPPAEPEKN
jgi:TonB family protein